MTAAHQRGTECQAPVPDTPAGQSRRYERGQSRWARRWEAQHGARMLNERLPWGTSPVNQRPAQSPQKHPGGGRTRRPTARTVSPALPSRDSGEELGLFGCRTRPRCSAPESFSAASWVSWAILSGSAGAAGAAAARGLCHRRLFERPAPAPHSCWPRGPRRRRRYRPPRSSELPSAPWTSSHHVVSPVSIEGLHFKRPLGAIPGRGRRVRGGSGRPRAQPPPASRTASANLVAQTSSQIRSAHELLGSRLAAACATSLVTDEATDVGVHRNELGHPIQLIDLEHHDRAIDILADEDQIEDTDRARVRPEPSAPGRSSR